MSLAALVLILLAAFAHSTWNLLAKGAANNEHFIWSSSICEAVLLLPLALWILADSWPKLGSGRFLDGQLFHDAFLSGARLSANIAQRGS